MDTHSTSALGRDKICTQPQNLANIPQRDSLWFKMSVHLLEGAFTYPEYSSTRKWTLISLLHGEVKSAHSQKIQKISHNMVCRVVNVSCALGHAFTWPDYDSTRKGTLIPFRHRKEGKYAHSHKNQHNVVRRGSIFLCTCWGCIHVAAMIQPEKEHSFNWLSIQILFRRIPH
jgi:hypothetical protein